MNIDDELLTEIKVIAARTRRPLGDVVDDALRLMLSRGSGPPAQRQPFPTFGTGGLQPGFDLEDKEALAELLGDNRLPGAPR